MICHIVTHFISVFNYPNPTYLWYVKRFYKCLYGLNKIFWDIIKEIWEKYFYITFYFDFLGMLGSIKLQRFKFQAFDIQTDVDSLLTNILLDKASPEKTCW